MYAIPVDTVRALEEKNLIVKKQKLYESHGTPLHDYFNLQLALY